MYRDSLNTKKSFKNKTTLWQTDGPTDWQMDGLTEQQTDLEVPIEALKNVSWVYKIESIPPPPAFDFLPHNTSSRVLKSIVFFPIKQ